MVAGSCIGYAQNLIYLGTFPQQKTRGYSLAKILDQCPEADRRTAFQDRVVDVEDAHLNLGKEGEFWILNVELGKHLFS